MIKAIDPQQLLMQMRALQTQANPSSQPAAQAGNEGGVNFANVMQNAVSQVNELQQSSNSLKTAFEMGDPNVNLTEVMIASQKASVAFEATLQVRNKMVEAYQEVMRMSI